MLSTEDRHVMTGNPSYAVGLVSRHLGLQTEMTISDDEDKLSSGLNMQCVMLFVQDDEAPNIAKCGTSYFLRRFSVGCMTAGRVSENSSYSACWLYNPRMY